MTRTTYATRIQAFLDQYPEAAPAYHDPSAERPIQRWRRMREIDEHCDACGTTKVTQAFGVQTRDGMKWVGRECNEEVYHHAKRVFARSV